MQQNDFLFFCFTILILCYRLCHGLPRARSRVNDPEGDMATFIDDVVPNF